MAFNSFMHPRNIYRQPPDFKQLASDFPEFGNFVISKGNKCFIDFKDPSSLRSLTKTLLKRDFGLTVEIPEDCLIPTVPQRLNYILWVEDLLTKLGLSQTVPKGIDIGTGPCCIFPLLGAKKNGWNFIATDVVEKSVEWAECNVKLNNLHDKIKVKKVEDKTIIRGVLTESDKLDFCMCNPPFFCNFEELQRKKKLPHDAKREEVIVNGGEGEFVKKIIDESLLLKENVRIYTSMLGRKQSLLQISELLKGIEGIKYVSTEFGQGNTMRWGIAWTFLKETDIGLVKKKLKRKVKRDFSFLVPQTVTPELPALKEMVAKVKSILNEFQVFHQTLCSLDSKAHLRITAYQNTWTHQRRKRRKMLNAKSADSVATVEQSCKLVSPTQSSQKDLEYSKKPSNSSLDTNNSSSCDFSHSDAGSHNSPTKRKFEESHNSVDHQNKRFLTVSNASKSSEELQDLLLNCDLFMYVQENGITLQFSCDETSNRETMYQIYQLLHRRLIVSQSDVGTCNSIFSSS